jgi:hypothetical protein
MAVKKRRADCESARFFAAKKFFKKDGKYFADWA